MNRGKWKRSRNPYGSPPRYDFLNHSCPFPAREYDSQRTSIEAKDIPHIAVVRLYPHNKKENDDQQNTNSESSHGNYQTDMEQNTNSTTSLAEENNDEEESEHNTHKQPTSLVEVVPPNAFRETDNVCYIKNAETQTQPQRLARGHITLTLRTEDVVLKDLLSQYHVELDVPLQPTNDVKEILNQEQDPCYFPITEIKTTGPQNNQPHKEDPTSSLPLLSHSSADAVPNRFADETRHRKRQKEENLCYPSAEKC